MCGIAGIVRTSLPERSAWDVLAAMARCLRHRGPDGDGILWDAATRSGLAHRRLAIVDPSPAGAQPMEDASGRFAITLNGEICSAPSLRARLIAVGHRFRGHSDTEVALAAIAEWGLEGAMARFNGMFAFALLDRVDRRLHLVRDRLGVKPLHYAWVEDGAGTMLAFASELRALLEVPGFRREIDPAAAAGFLSHLCVPGEACIWRGARKLAPGCRLEMDLDSGDARIHRYWDPLAVAEAGCDAPLSGTDDEIVDQVDSSIREVVRDHLLSDMPVGCFLSGGIDSATVLAAARGATDRPIRAFTAGFESPELDERATARRTASALGVELVEIEMNARAMLRIVPELPDVHDEPFADSSQIPTLLVSREMRRHASVALSGDGGDEIFGGYHRHAHAATGWPRERFLPRHVRRAIGRSARTLSPRTWDRCLAIIGPLRRGGLRSAGAGARLHKWADALASDSERDAYETITSMWPRGMPPFPDNSATSWWSVEAASRLPDFLRRMQYMDQTGYLVDDALVKVDRMSMAASLEVRVPLLDHRLVELAWRLPVQARVRDGQGKWILRRILDRHVPSSIVRAPKAGFAVPLDAWLRGPLRTWARDRVIGGMEHARRILDADARTRAWERFEAGRFPADAIWSIAMLVSWCERWGADR